jgi:integrase
VVLLSGMRKGEIVNLRWEQIDISNKVVLFTDTKNGDQRGVPLNRGMVELLAEIQGEQERYGLGTPFVFAKLPTKEHGQNDPNKGKPYRRDADSAWYTALKAAELRGLHFHDLRHTTGSHLRMQGADLFTIKEILGHKDLRMTARYAHVGQQHRLAAVNLLETAYGQKSSRQ